MIALYREREKEKMSKKGAKENDSAYLMLSNWNDGKFHQNWIKIVQNSITP